MMLRSFLAGVVLLAGSTQVPAAVGQGAAEIMPRAIQATLLDVAQTPRGYIVVGARGHVLMSADGRHWQQKPVPVRAMLNRVVVLPDGHLFAVGHDGVILASEDGGEHWQLRHQDISDQRPNTLYDLAFVSPTQGYAIGAFGLMLGTADGGRSWQRVDNALTQAELHLNGITQLDDNTLMVVGERGLVALSRDRGTTWKLSSPPYTGSFFGVLPISARSALVFGQRGHVYSVDDVSRLVPGDPAGFDPLVMASPDDAQALKLGFRRIPLPAEDSLFGGARLADGRSVLVGADAGVLVLTPDLAGLRQLPRLGAATYARVLPQPGRLMVVGLQGISAMTLPEPAP